MGDVYRSHCTISTNNVRLRKEIALKTKYFVKGKNNLLKEEKKMFGYVFLYGG